jgi:TP901 family phage tail tape measure protein
MAVELATGYISLVPSAKGIGKSIADELGGTVGKAAGEAGEDAGKKISTGLLAGVKGTGAKLLTELGLATLGVFAFKAATDVEDANNIIARSTGATGKALEGLQESFRNIASTSGASFSEIATTLSQLSQRTGLTGKALEQLTSQVLTFNRISKDSPITVDALTKALAGFNVPGSEMGKVLDHLFIIAQKTGVPLSELLSTLQTAGPVARQFGFSVEFTATLLAQLNRAGLDANQILPGLRTAFVNFAKAGKEPAAALRETLDQINALIKAGDIAQARQLAVQIFGARGAGLVDAALAGKLSLDQLGTAISTAGAGILEVAGKTGTLTGALAVLRNNLKLALAEFATPALEAANEALRAVLPTVRDIGKEFAKLPDPIKIVVAGLVGLATLAGPLGQLGQGIEGLGKIVGGLSNAFAAATNAGILLIANWEAIGAAVTAFAATILLPLVALTALGFGLHKVFGTDLVGQLEKAESAAKKWADVQIAGAKATKDPLVSLNATLRLTQTQLQDMSKDGDTSADAIFKVAFQAKELKTQIAGIEQARKEEAKATAETAASLDTYNAAVISGGDATDTFATLTDEAKRAVLEFQGAVLAAAGGEIGREQALLNQATAQQNLADKTVIRMAAEERLATVMAESGPDSVAAFLASEDLRHAREDEAAATLDSRSAELQAAAATDELAKVKQDLIDKIRESPGFYDAEIARLNKEIELHPINAAGYQQEIDKLVAAKIEADKLDAEAEKHITITVHAEQAISQLNLIADGLHALDLPEGVTAGLDFVLRLLGQLPHAATGGIFSKPEIRLFAEAGPEAVLPLNDRARSLQILAETGLLSDGGGGTATATIGTSGLHIDTAIFGDRDVIPALDYWQRTRMAAS